MGGSGSLISPPEKFMGADSVLRACDALHTAQSVEELWEQIHECLATDFGIEQVLVLSYQDPQHVSYEVFQTSGALQRPELDPSEREVQRSSRTHRLSEADRDLLTRLQSSPSSLNAPQALQGSSLYHLCVQALGTEAFVILPLRKSAEEWKGFICLPEPASGSRPEHLRGLLVFAHYVGHLLNSFLAPGSGAFPDGQINSNEVVATIAHELRNPLNSIKGAAQFLRAKYSDHPSVFKFLNIIIGEVDNLARLTTALLEFARPLQLDLQPAQVNAIIADVLSLMQYHLREHHIKVVESLAPILPTLRLDAKQIEQAFRNAVLNAIEAMPGGGELLVSSRLLGRGSNACVEVRMSDNGVGIPAEDVEKVFTSFYTTKPEGTGLGLPILQKIVRSHRGEVFLESAPGVGTTLIIQLPVAPGAR